MQFYDSDLQSDNPDDFESDNEQPQDQVKDVKFITKDQLTRINKQIFKCGKGIPKPAKYDEIFIKAIKFDQNPETEYKDNISKIEQEKKYSVTLGYNSYPEWWEMTVESMKKGEISSIKIEHLKFDQNQMKVLDREEYWLFEMVDWNTCIDLDMDSHWFKYVKNRGIGQDKPEKFDEISFSYTLKNEYSDQILSSQNYEEKAVKIVNLLESEDEKGIPKSIWKIMRSMKKGEEVKCRFSREVFDEREKDVFKKINNDIVEKTESNSQQFQEEQKLKIKESDEQNNIIRPNQDPIGEVLKQDCLVAQINIIDIIKVDDIFGDGNAQKRIIYNGQNTSKPEKIALSKFELEIYVESKKIYSSKYKDVQKLEKREVQFWENYLDDFKISKLLKNALRRMKMKEIATVTCKDPSLITNGKDYEIIKNQFEGKVPQEVVYIIKVISYTEGRNNFNMTIDEKINHAIRKKQTGVQLIKDFKNYKKALKSFEAINAYFEYGTFYEEDKVAMYEHQLSALLNTSLCYQHTQQWAKLIIVCDKITKLNPNNSKAVYRKAIALKNQELYQYGFDVLKEFLEKNEDNIDNGFKQDIQKLQIQLQQLQDKQINKEKKMFKNMFTD